MFEEHDGRQQGKFYTMGIVYSLPDLGGHRCNTWGRLGLRGTLFDENEPRHLARMRPFRRTRALVSRVDRKAGRFLWQTLREKLTLRRHGASTKQVLLLLYISTAHWAHWAPCAITHQEIHPHTCGAIILGTAVSISLSDRPRRAVAPRSARAVQQISIH